MSWNGLFRASGRRRSPMSRLRSGGDIAVDLGTANTVVYVRGRGIVLSEPSVVAIDQRTGEVHEAMLRQFVDKVLHSRFSRPRMVICAPSGITEVERRAVEEATLSAGAREVHLIEESLAAAIGAGIDIAEPVGRMVVDVGGGTSEVAVVSLGGLVVARSLRVGGYDLDDAITNHIRLEHRMAIGSQSAEAIKLAAGSAIPLREEIETSIRGRDLASGLPREILLTSEEIRLAIAQPLAEIMAAIHATLEETPPELAADITSEGILLAGGGSLLRGFDSRVLSETGMPV